MEQKTKGYKEGQISSEYCILAHRRRSREKIPFLEARRCDFWKKLRPL
jgi:hypothetical protein